MISVLCPTRGRPKECAEMVRTAADTSLGEVEVLLYLDEDDPTVNDYAKQVPLNLDAGRVRVRPLFGRRDGLGRAWNRLAANAAGDVLKMGNDDERYQTPGWDGLISAALSRFPLGLGVVWGADGVRNACQCLFPCTGVEWRRRLGHWTPECFRFYYHDTWIWDIARLVGRTQYLPSVRIPHHASQDGLYRETHTRAMIEADGRTWQETALERERLARKLIGGDER